MAFQLPKANTIASKLKEMQSRNAYKAKIKDIHLSSKNDVLKYANEIEHSNYNNIPGTSAWIKKKECEFDKYGKIPVIEHAFNNKLEKDIAYMIATSHEYNKPNVRAALSFVKNYKWELSEAKIKDLQGINKPVNYDKVENMAKNLHKVKPFIVVNQFNGIRPQTPGKKILVDGHHRKEACILKGIDVVPVYKGTYTGKAEKSFNELKEKTASEYIDAMFRNYQIDKIAQEQNKEKIFYHASPVQNIKRFRRSEDTSGNNKGRIIFGAEDPAFAAAFGLRWHDGIARLDIETKDSQPPTKDNYVGSILRITDKVNTHSPCSMYKLKGNFKPLRYDNDLESYADSDVQIISEEKFKSFDDMAKAYGLEVRKVSEQFIRNKLKYKKTSNFEKAH